MFDPVISGLLTAIAISSLLGGVGIVFLATILLYRNIKQDKLSEEDVDVKVDSKDE